MQDRAITAIGKIELESKSNLEAFELYIQNMFPKENYRMLLGVFSIGGKPINDGIGISFLYPKIENVSSINYGKYLYRKGSARGGDITFTTKAGNLEKKLNTFRSQVKNTLQFAKQNSLQREHNLFTNLDNYLESNFLEFQNRLIGVYHDLDKKEQQKCGFSLLFIENGEEKYLRNFEVCKLQILDDGITGKYSKYGVESKSQHNTCSICLKEKNQVFGFASPFKYATVDKVGFVSGFFDQRSNWKNYPICSECAIELETGEKFVSTKLRKSFYGNSYFIVPKSVIPGDFTNLSKALKRIEKIEYEKIARLNKSEDTFIQKKEDSLFRLLGEEENTFSVSLLFFEENPTTKAINILMMLEEVFPSTFRKIFIDSTRKVNDYAWYKGQIKVKKRLYDLEFHFGLIKAFFPAHFYEMIHKVFNQEKLATEFLWKSFMNLIRSNRNKMKSHDGFVESTYLTVLKAHLLIRYFAHLGLISINSKPIIMEETTELNSHKKSFDIEGFKLFIEENPEFFDKEYKVGIFSVGILVRLLMNYQDWKLNSTPFENKLKGLNLNGESIKTIYRETLYKLSQYQKKFYVTTYTELRDLINTYFTLQTPEISKCSNNEISFFFVAGLEFGNKFKTKSQKEDNE